MCIRDRSVEELKDLRETGAPALPIGKDKALEIAMAASGFSADEVYTETDSDLDENPAHYDVEIKHNGTEDVYKRQVVRLTLLLSPCPLAMSGYEYLL